MAPKYTSQPAVNRYLKKLPKKLAGISSLFKGMFLPRKDVRLLRMLYLPRSPRWISLVLDERM